MVQIGPMRELVTVVALLASAVIVLGGLAATVRALLGTRDELRDNTRATRANTDSLQQFGTRLNQLEGRVAKLERLRLKRLDWCPPHQNHGSGPGPVPAP